MEGWKDSDVHYKLSNIKGIHVIGYFFSHKNLNCIAHINYPDLLEWGTPGWLNEIRLRITLCLYDISTDLILEIKYILLSEEDTFLVKELCHNVQHWQKMVVESAIRFIYEVKFEEIIW